MKAMHVEQDACILGQDFLDWWFAPWHYLDMAGLPGLGDKLVARRDGYRAWCEQAGLTPDLPGLFDPGWQSAALQHAALLRHRAGLFGGLFVARARAQDMLKTLTPEARSWCQRVSLAQPLTRCVADSALFSEASPDVVMVGLAELAWRLEQDFPGMWTRLRWLLDPPERTHLDLALSSARRQQASESPAAGRRALRCWQFCSARSQSG
jgi:hypothetical protein